MTLIVIYYLLISVASLFAALSWVVEWDLSKRTGHNNNVRLVVVTLVDMSISFVDSSLYPMWFLFCLRCLLFWLNLNTHRLIET